MKIAGLLPLKVYPFNLTLNKKQKGFNLSICLIFHVPKMNKFQMLSPHFQVTLTHFDFEKLSLNSFSPINILET